VRRELPVLPFVLLALALVAVVAYIVVIMPARSESARLDDEIAALRANVASSRGEKKTSPAERVKVSELIRLARVMPDGDSMPVAILELNSLATASGGEITAIEPQPEKPHSSYREIPIKLTFQGNYYELTDFIYRLRNLVRVDDGRLEVAGSLYNVGAVDLHESERSFPEIEAVLTVGAYVFGPAASSSANAGGSSTTPATQTPTPSSTGPTPDASGSVATTSAPAQPTGQGAPGGRRPPRSSRSRRSSSCS
jgi:Pilus assembly protein, PilO